MARGWWTWACGAAALTACLVACATLPVAPLDGPDVDDASPESSTTAEPGASDAAVTDAADAAASDGDADAAPVVLKRVSGHVEFNGPVAGAAVTMLAPMAMSTTTDQAGDFFFYAPVGSSAVVKVVAPNAMPMIRGVVVSDPSRIRVFYLAGASEQQAAQALGKTFDPTKGIVEVDFRNANVGGYSVVMTKSGAAVTPGFGIALDGAGDPQLATETLVGGDGSTLLLADVAPGTVSFAPLLPDAGVTACKPCDAPALPIQAGVVTWFDFECGSATDCQ
jgi:hypothetical protein